MSQVTPIFNVVLPAVARKTTTSSDYGSLIEKIQVTSIQVLYSGTDTEGNSKHPDISVFQPGKNLSDISNISNFGYSTVTGPIDVTTVDTEPAFLGSISPITSYPMVVQRSSVEAATEFEGTIPSSALPTGVLNPTELFGNGDFIGYEWRVLFKADSGIPSPVLSLTPDNYLQILLPYTAGVPIRFNTVAWLNSDGVPIIFFIGRNHILNDTVTEVRWSVKIVFITSYIINSETASLSNAQIVNL